MAGNISTAIATNYIVIGVTVIIIGDIIENIIVVIAIVAADNNIGSRITAVINANAVVVYCIKGIVAATAAVGNTVIIVDNAVYVMIVADVAPTEYIVVIVIENAVIATVVAATVAVEKASIVGVMVMMLLLLLKVWVVVI